MITLTRGSDVFTFQSPATWGTGQAWRTAQDWQRRGGGADVYAGQLPALQQILTLAFSRLTAADQDGFRAYLVDVLRWYVHTCAIACDGVTVYNNARYYSSDYSITQADAQGRSARVELQFKIE